MTQSVQPPPPVQPSASVSAVMTIQPVAAAVTNDGASHAPSPLANLPAGTMVEGFVINRDAQGNPILRTPIGDLRVTSEVFLKTGSEVVFKVDTSQASLARILSVDGLTPQNYNAQNNTRGISKDTITQTALMPSMAQLTATGKPVPGAPVLQALVLQPHPPTALTPFSGALTSAQSGQLNALTQLAQLQAGTPVSLTLRELKLPPMPVPLAMVADTNKLDALLPPKAQAATSPQPAASNIGTGSAPAQQQNNPIQAGSMALPGAATAAMDTELTPIQAALQQRAAVSSVVFEAQHSPEALLAKSVLMTPQQQSSAPASKAPQPQVSTNQQAGANTPNTAPQNQPVSAANQVMATVIGHEADGANILHTPFATLKLYTAQPLPTGTGLIVEVGHEIAPQPAPATALQAGEKFINDTMRDWQSLDDVISWLKTNSPDIAREALQKLPTMDHKLASSLLFFVAALKGGDVNEIIGKRATRLLSTSAPEILAKLRGDIGQIQANIMDSPLTNWTLMTLPMLFGQELQQARLYVSKEPPEEKKSEGDQGRGHRFVLEVGMSALGPLQFDGFVRNQENRKSFDLVVRSSAPLSDDINQGIRNIFTNSLEITGMRGQVLFQPGSQHFIRPLAEPKANPGGGGVNTILA